jgi:hypothetical protein
MKAFIFTLLLLGLGTLLNGQPPPQSLVISPPTIPDGQYGSSYNQHLNGNGGMAPYSFSVSGGAVPPGISLSTTGVFSGTPTAAGTYSFAVTVQDNSPAPGPYSTSQNYTLVIDPVVLQIKVNNANMTYGAALPSLGVSYNGFVNGDNASSLTTQPTVTTTATSASPPGNYPITASGAVDPNYTFTYQPGMMTVGKASLTVTADNKSMPLGGPLPALTVSYTGFVNGDNASSLVSQPMVTTPANANSPAGTYPITPHGGSSPNYTFSYVNGTLTVGQAVLTITANPAGSVYGGPLVPAGSLTVSYSGFVNGDGPANLAVRPIVTNSAVAGAPVGSYNLIPSGAVDPNYTMQYVNGNYTISPAALTITANNATMPYGGTIPALHVSYTGFVNGDNASSLSTQPTISTTATAASPAGTYPITASGAVDPNYTFAYQAGTMTVGKASLTVTADNKSMPLGGPLPPLTVSYTGFVNGDNASSLSTPPTLTTTATSTSPAGTYPITASGAVDQNYSITYSPGTLTIVSRPSLVVTANSAKKEYGTPDPTFTYSASGFLNGDNSDIFSGSLSRAPGENVGIYPITEGSLSAGSNYTIVFTGNFLTIAAASQEITWTQSLAVGCNGTTQVQLNATASSGLPVTYSVSNNGIATVSGNVLTLLQPGTAFVTATQAGDANHSAAVPVRDTVFYQATSLISQHWNDVIFFDNSSGDYVAWQWYKNDSLIAGATSPYYSETPSLNGQYFVIATNKDSQQIQSCTLTITGGAPIPGGIRVYPNPAKPGETATVTCNYPSAALQGAILQVIDITGKVRQQITNVQPSTQVTLPSEGGIYIINLVLANGAKAAINVLVAN